MCKRCSNKAQIPLFSQSGTISLDTLAKSGTNLRNPDKRRASSVSQNATYEDSFISPLASNFQEQSDPDYFPLLTKGTDFSDKKTLQNRAKRKYISSKLAEGLVDFTNAEMSIAVRKMVEKEAHRTTIWRAKNPFFSKNKSYWNMWHCANTAELENGKFKTRYCKNRLCIVCNSIRTAELTNKYRHVLKAWDGDMWFITLTAQTVSDVELRDNIKERERITRLIFKRLDKRHRRHPDTHEKPRLIKKIECTYRVASDKYHPHQHLIVKGEETAKAFLKMWIEDAKHLGVDPAAQDIQKADENTHKELFKYFTKVISDGGAKEESERAIYLHAVDTIFQAIKGIHTFRPMGFKISQYDPVLGDVVRYEQSAPTEASRKLEDISQENLDPEIFRWNHELNDWVGTRTGELASGHVLSESIEQICASMKMPARCRNEILYNLLDSS